MQIITLLFIAAWLTLAGTDAARADPFSAIAAIASFLASGSVLAQVALFAIGTAIKIGLSLLKKQEKAAVAGTKTEIDVGGDNPISFVMGRYATAGQLVYVNTNGSNNDAENGYVYQVISLGDLPGQGITGLWIYDEKVDISGFTGPESYNHYRGFLIEEFASDETGRALWFRYYDGTQTEADAYLVDEFGADPDYPFTADMVGRGTPYIILTAAYDPEIFSGIPQVLVETDGIPLYDPRQDSSVGGNGSQRWSDPSTWAPSSNNIVQVYNVLRGIRYQGEWIWGGQSIGAHQLPLANWFAAMNACDAAIALQGGGSEPQFRSGLEVSTDQEPADVVEELLKGCNGYIAEVGGVYKVSVGAPAAPVYSFTDASIVVTQPQQLDPFPGLQNTTNGARASYPEPEEKWVNKDAPPYIRPDLETADDGRRLLADLKFPYVPFNTQVQRLIRAAVEDARRFRQHQITLPPEAWAFEPLDVFAWSSDRNGYEEKRFLVTGMSGGSNLLQTVTLKEIDPSDYSWSPASDERPYSVGFLGTIRPGPQAFSGWQVAAAAIADPATGRRRPSIAIFYAGGQIDVTDIRVQVRNAATGDVVFDATMAYDAPLETQYSRVLNGTFLPETAYEARGIYRSVSGRRFVWSEWLPVTTGVEDLQLGLDQLAQEARAILDGLREDLDAAVVEAGEMASELEGQADALAAETQTRAAEAAALAQEIAAEVQARIASAGANADAIAAEAQARADAIAALAAEDADLADALAAEASTRASAATALAATDAALAQDIAAESVARADGIAAEAQARIDAIADQAGALNAEAEQRLAEIRIQAVSLRALSDRLLDIDTVLAESASLGLDQLREVRTRIDVTRDEITAAYTRAITVATGPTSALAQRLDSLEVGIEDEESLRTAEITRLDQAIVTGDAAQASAREILSTQIRGGYTGSDAALAGGMIGSLRSTFASQYEAITESLVSLEAGVDEQFDFLRFWPFDDDAEGWIGNGTPTWATGGWLRPANQASDPYVVSADDLDIDADRYGQVRARIRRTGAPVWEGRLYWNDVVGQAWSAGRSATITEPTFSDNGTAVISFETGATGTIERLRLDLSAAQTATDYFEIDWVAIGRPSPGASIASQEALRQTVVNGLASEATAREQLSSQMTGFADPTGVELESLSSGLLYEERTARTTADSALSESILGLESSISDASGAITATASALQSITTRVSTAEETIGTQGTAIVSNTEALTALSGQLAGKADTSAIDQLSQEIALLGGDGLQSQATSIRSLSARLQDLELDLAEQEALGLAGDTATREAVATAYQQLDAYTRRVEGRVETEASRIDGLQVTLAGKVDASALNSLTVRVLQQGNAITTSTASVTALASTVAGKADVSALNSLSTTVTQQGAALSTQGLAITSLQGSLDDKANASAVDTLGQTVTSQGEDITANAEAITALSTAIDGKASTAALSSLSATVTGQGEDIAVNTSAITSLETSVAGKADASAVNDLAVVVTSQGEDIETLVTSVTALETALPGKADASAVSSLQTTVSEQGTAIASNSSAITSLQGSLDNKADASALSSLSQTVSDQDGDITANADAITALGSAISGKADASAVSTLQTTVTEHGTAITSNATAITSLQGALDGKASTSAVDALQQEITLLGGEGLQSQASAIRSVSAQLLDLEMGLAEQGALGIAGDTATRQAIATASQQLDAYTRQVEGRIEVNAAAITALQASLPDKADVTMVNAARASLIEQGVRLTAQGEQIASLSIEVSGKASTSLVDALSATIIQQGSAISVNTSAITSLQGAIDDKADASAVDQLSQVVETLGGENLQSQASAIRSVTARLQDLEMDLAEQEALGIAGDTATRQAVATAYQQLDAYTRLVDGKVETQASRIDGLQVTLGAKVDANALNALRVTVIQQGNSITSNTSAITSLSTTVAGKADVSALNSLSTTVVQQGQAISATADAVDAVAAALPDKADASAVSSLQTAVTEQGTAIASNAAAITALDNAIDDKADASAVSTLTTTVSEQGTAIASNATAITSLQGALDNKADASALSSLSQTVSDQDGDITANADAITSLNTALDGKADASAVSTLSTTVAEQGGAISAQATQLTALATSVGDISADARFRTTVKSQPSGSEATMAMQVRAGDASAWREAGIYLRAASDGSADVIVSADRFAVTNNTGETVPFAVQNGQVALALARFQQLASFNGKLVIDGVAGTISVYD
ncbi:DUF1983 domain-containing protein [Aurantimonas sp. 22II-16-19i]|uniref:DUF1983 domain-containing protein n=1 Tax=Aurantimonas sp. 22II-16-19i TaxID=1317114 RepID=UPI0009F7CC39|nr:DUF1983 domain-containing protein [Aurantimonas sp. 22II-16-19i]ORE89737.1 hypothetical protein ATO4_23702 [Aurantimonas sp. 22II-16-19i]